MLSSEKQRIFNLIHVHLLTQKAKSKGYVSALPMQRVCAYRGDGGRKCPIGYLILDSIYTPDMEGHGIKSLLITWAILASGYDIVEEGSIEFLQELQNIHDELFVEDWEHALAFTAEQHGLNIP